MEWVGLDWRGGDQEEEKEEKQEEEQEEEQKPSLLQLRFTQAVSILYTRMLWSTRRNLGREHGTRITPPSTV